MKTGLYCLVNQNNGNACIVELPNKPEVGETKPISPTEVKYGAQPNGTADNSHTPARTVIQITADLGEQYRFGKHYKTFAYIPASL